MISKDFVRRERKKLSVFITKGVSSAEGNKNPKITTAIYCRLAREKMRTFLFFGENKMKV